MSKLFPLFSAAMFIAVPAFCTESPITSKQPARDGYAVEFALSDQHEQAHSIKFPRDKVAVFVLSDHKGSPQIEGWVTPLYQRYEKRIDIAGVADLPNIPSAFHGLFRREFKKQLGYPVMLDWSGEIAKAFGYQRERANLFVIGRDGRIAIRKIGPVDEAALQAVIRVIDGLLGGR